MNPERTVKVCNNLQYVLPGLSLTVIADTPASEIIEDQVQTAAEEKPALSPAQQRRLSYLHKKIARTVEKMKVPGITEREFGHHQKRVDRWDAEALKLKFSTSTTENAGKNWCIKKSSGRKAQKYTQLSGVHLQYPTIVFTFKNKKRGATTTQASGTASVAKKDRGNEGKFVVTASDSFTTHHVKKVTTSPTIEINEGELTDNDSGPVEKPKPLTRVQLAKIHTLQKLRGPLRRSAEPDEEDSDSSSDIMSPKPAPTTPNIPKVYVELPAVDNPSRDPSLEPVPIFPTPASKRRSGKVSRKSTKTTQRFEPYGGRNKKSRPVLPVTPMSVPSKDSSEEPEPAERQSLSLPRGIGIFLVTKNTTVQASTNCSDSTASNINLLEIYRRTKRKSTPISYWENLKENQQHVTFKTNWVSTNTAPRLHLYTNIQKVSGKRRGTGGHDKPGQHYPR
jgi:hypothetical protein